MIIMGAKIFLEKNDTSKFGKEIQIEEANKIIQKIGEQFNIDIKNIIKNVADQKIDYFSLNKNSPYKRLYIGNGSGDISVRLITSGKKMKLKIPSSSFLG